MTRESVALVGIPVVAAVLTVVLLARRTQGSLEASGAQMERDLTSLGRQSEAELRQRAARWARESEAYFAGKIPQYVSTQAQAATSSIGLTPELLERFGKIGARVDDIRRRIGA